MKAVTPMRTRALVLVAVAAVALAACSSSKKTGTGTSSTTASGGSSGTTLKIGFFGELTGANANLGVNILDGEKLAVSQYNATNPSVKVEVDPFDSQGSASQANNGSTKLIGDHVVAVVGPAFSGESEAADPLFEAAQIPYVSASATAVDLATKGRKFFHRVLAGDDIQGPADADYLVKTLGVTKLAIVDDNTSYGQPLASAVETQAKTDGASIVVTDHIDPTKTDYSQTVNKVIAANANGIFFGGYYANSGPLVQQLRQKGFTGKFMSGDGSEDPHFVTAAGGSPGAGGAAEGAYLSCACADETSNPAAASFVSGYQSMFSTPPAIYSAESYDATNFILAAIKAGNTTGTAINTYLTNQSFTGVTKTVKFQADGNISGGGIYIYEVKSGKVTQIGSTS